MHTASVWAGTVRGCHHSVPEKQQISRERKLDLVIICEASASIGATSALRGGDKNKLYYDCGILLATT